MKFFLLVLLSVSTLVSQSLPYPLRSDETLTYNAKFKVIPAGTASLTQVGMAQVNNENTIHVEFIAKTGTVADRLFKIRDRIDTWLRIDDLTTVKQVKKIREGSYKKNRSMTIDKALNAIITESDTVAINGEIRDTYSLLYYLRTIPHVIGDTLSFTTFNDGKYTSFKGSFHRKETIYVPAGKFVCNVFKPFRVGKSLFKNEGDMIIWFSENNHHMPVQIQIKLKFGSMILKLTDYTYKE